MQTQEIVMLPVESVISSTNVRFGLKKSRVESLAQSILDTGGIQEPLTVYPTDKKGVYAVFKGNYRLAAAEKINKDAAGVVELPCIIRETAPTDLERIKLQVVENVQREDMSPMDIAHAAKQMLDSGMTKTEIRNMFIRAGGRKGVVIKAMSNSILNIYLSFLGLPKTVQNLIHDGIMPVTAAMELQKHPKEKWDSIVQRCKDEWAEADANEEKADEKLLAAEEREAAKAAKAAEEAKKLEETRKALAEAQKEAEEQSKVEVQKREEAGKVYLSKAKLSDKEELAAAEKRIKELEAEATVAKRKQSDAVKAAEKAAQALDKATAAAAERAKKDKERADAATPRPIRAADVAQAAAAEGSGTVRLKGPEMRQAIVEMGLPGAPPKAAAIAASILRCYDGELTNTQMFSEVCYHTGERKEGKPKTLVAYEKRQAEVPKEKVAKKSA